MLQFQSVDPQRNLGLDCYKLDAINFGHAGTLSSGGDRLSSMGLGFCSCQSQVGSLRPRNSGTGFMFGEKVKTMKLEDYKYSGVELAVHRRSRRSGSCVVRPRSLLSVDKVVEGGENEIIGGEKQYDAIVIGSGIGGLVAATQLAVKGARVLVLEKYVIPGGSSGFYQRDGYTFDVGSSVMFGFSDKVSFNYFIPS